MAESHREEIAKLEALYANNPEGRVFTHLAEAYRKGGELDRALEILERGLERHEDYASAHVVLGRVRMDLGETESARAAFRRVLELDRHNLIALRSLGELSSAAGEPGEALHYYRELLSLDPADDRLRLTVMRLEEEAGGAPVVRSVEEAAAAAYQPPAMFATPGMPGVSEAEPAAAPEAASEHAEPEAAGEAPAASAAVAADWESEVGPEQEPLPGDLVAISEPGFEAMEPAAEPFAPARDAAGEEGTAREPVEREAVDTSAFAPPGELGSPTLATSVPDRGSAPPPWQPAGALEGGVVLTETIAELYAAQGLHGRAAEVYRSLLAERPDDARLEERLRASEAALAGAGATAAGPEADESASWLEGVESAWTGGAGVAGAGPTPYAWTDPAQAEDAGGGARIADWFRDLLAWRPEADSTRGAEPLSDDGAAGAEAPVLAVEGSAAGAAADDSLERAAGAGEDGTTEEDEDLEMFRSWLQSLKK